MVQKKNTKKRVRYDTRPHVYGAVVPKKNRSRLSVPVLNGRINFPYPDLAF